MTRSATTETQPPITTPIPDPTPAPGARGGRHGTQPTNRTSSGLNRYRQLTVDGAKPQRATIPAHLTTVEQDLYGLLANHAAQHATGLLLEQERIPWAEAAPHLRRALAAHNTP